MSRLIPAAAVLALLSRLPVLGSPAFADEAGFLAVGRGWQLGSGGASLYGDYWVDRPPALITLYGVADRLGGLVALRLMGAVAAVVVVLAVADICWTAARGIHARRAAGWGAVAAAALISSPFHGSFMVDGELLAAPAAAIGIALMVRAQRALGRRKYWYAAGAGMFALVAAMTKQNFLDVFVFCVGLAAAALVCRAATWRQVRAYAGAFTGGATAMGVVLATWTLAHGTTLGGVWYALFPFRVDAAAAKGGTAAISGDRLADLGVAALLSGLLVVVVVSVVLAARSRRDPVVIALVLVLAYDAVSIAGGTSYWLHYLVQPVLPAAALLGILVPRMPSLRLVAAGCAALSLVGWLALVAAPPQTAEEVVGEAVGRASKAGDRLITFPGHSNVNLAAGLESSYPHLWSLPARTLDPRSARLKLLLASGSGPEWVVAWAPLRPVPPPRSVGSVLGAHYRKIAEICGVTVFLRSDVDRSAPRARPRDSATAESTCASVTRLPPILRDLR